MSRITAAVIHVGISLCIFAVLVYLVVFRWYPDFFFASDGGWQGIRILALVDVVLGPTLTLTIFDIRKPRRALRRDLTLIGLFQACCLSGGIYVVYMQKPLALVYVDGVFSSVSADDYREAGVTVPDLDAFPGRYPKQLVVAVPDDLYEQSRVRSGAWQRGQPLNTLSSHYVPYDYDRLDADREALSPEWLSARDAETGDLARWLSQHGGSVGDYAFFPLGVRYEYLVLGVSRETGDIIGTLATPVKERSGIDEDPTSGKPTDSAG